MSHRKPLAAALITVFALLIAALPTHSAPQEIAPGVFFRLSEGGSNIGWIVFQDYVLVIDAHFPDQAEAIIKDIKSTTDKPIRFVFNTHHHGDHAFGNNVFAAAGAVAVAQQNCLDVLMKAQEQYDQWAQGKDDYMQMGLKTPTITFANEMAYDDGNHRVELIYFGHGHTPGDAVAYLPKEKVLFTGDLCVNGPFNYMGDADTESWVEVLEKLQGLDVKTVGPGHGPLAGKKLLETQKNYFIELRKAVARGIEEDIPFPDLLKTPIASYKEWTGQENNPAHIRHVYDELTGVRIPREVTVVNPKIGPSFTKDTPGWTAPKKMLVRNLSEKELKELQRIAPTLEFINVRTNSEAREAIADVDGMMGPIEPGLLEQAEKLRWVHSITAGIEGYLFPEFVNNSAVLTNGQGSYGPAMADHVMGYMLLFSKKLPKRLQSQWQGKWDRADGADLMELRGKTLLILGLGGIGREVAKRAAGFDMNILAIDPQVTNHPRYVTYIGQPDEMKTLLPKADFVVCSVPLTPHTLHYIDAECFDLMKDTAYFINVARGEVIVQDDLIQALQNKTIAGAALDVTDPEPLPDGHPLWKLENIVITPHMSGRTTQSYHRRWLLLKENIRRFATGETLLNVVDKQRGY